MTQRAETLAAAFEQAAGSLLTAAGGLSEAAWGAVPAGEARTAGQIVYHMAEVYGGVGGFIQMALAGQPLPPLTMDLIHAVNVEQAARSAGTARAEILALLREHAGSTAALVRGLTDAQLDTATEFVGYHLTVAELVQNALVGHSEEHLASIQRAAASA